MTSVMIRSASKHFRTMDRRAGRGLGVALLAASAVAALAPAAAAQGDKAPAAPTRRARPITVRLTPVHPMPVTAPAGPQSGQGGVAGGGCPPVISSHTNFDFVNGGQANLQGGFAEGEIAAAQYFLTAADFPFIIDSIEVIVAQNHFNQTITKYSILVWEGPPNAGSLIFDVSSDDIILPHIQLPVGNPPAQAVNLLFQVDPGDPEQIQVNSNPTNSFTVGFRIDDHNNQTQNPCLVAPPATQNAFPTTDLGGVSSMTGNWLFGLNCGPFGCPANGGWATFQQLPGSPGTLCTPSGDWIIRATRRPFTCGPATGACCLPTGACTVTTQTLCQQQSGTYQGNNTLCGFCPIPNVACCFPGGGCLNLSQINCQASGGTPGPVGSNCATHVCFPIGACCLPDGSCQNGLSPEQCQALNGTFQGNNTNCGTITCPLPTGACCFATGFCLALTQADCAQAPGAVWAGPGTTCVDANANGQADACETASNPADLNGDGSVNGLDLGILLINWSIPPSAPGCGGAVPCPSDLNGDGLVNGLDLGILLGAWTG
jgi:hypothetical protein